MKTALIRYRKVLRKSFVDHAKKKYRYDKIIFLCEECRLTEEEVKKEKKVDIRIAPKRSFSRVLRELQEEYGKRSFLLPFFVGDDNSKFNIQVYNSTFGTKVPPKIFKEKSTMNAFLGDSIQKRNIRLSYEDLKQLSYEELKEKVGEEFILKPLNASSSVLSVRIASEHDLEMIRPKLQRKYRYILEEYMQGKLYSLDFYFDGKQLFFLCYAREMFFGEILKKLQKEDDEERYPPEFFYFLPVRYTLDLKKLSKTERQFVQRLAKKLEEIEYRGIVHLEYRYDQKQKKIGFIEWGARPGGYRRKYTEEMHQYLMENLPVDILLKKDYGRFRHEHGVYFLRGRDSDTNFVTIKANVLQKTHIMQILRKNPEKYLEVSFQKFLKNFLWDLWKVKVEQISFQVRTSSDYYLYPLHERSDTRFSYTMELKEKSFQRFLQKKYRILERLVFHEYLGKSLSLNEPDDTLEV